MDTRGPFFRMTPEERDHVERLMREADEWPVGTPMQPDKMREHIDGAKLAAADLRGRINRLVAITVLWVLTWVLIMSASAWIAASFLRP